MIKLYVPLKGDIYLAKEAIAQITPAGTSQAWHGFKANVQTFDGKWVEVADTPEQIARMVEEAQ